MRQMVCEPLANGLRTKCEYMWMGLRTKCAYMWMGLQTCAAPFAKGSHTVHHEPKFFSFLRKHKENWMRLHAPGVLCSPQIHGKLINCMQHANGATHKRRTRVYKVLDNTQINIEFVCVLCKNIGTTEQIPFIYGSICSLYSREGLLVSSV